VCRGLGQREAKPAIPLPLHWSADGLRVGVQLVATYGREDLLFRVAAQLEEAAPWCERRPPLHARAVCAPREPVRGGLRSRAAAGRC